MTGELDLRFIVQRKRGIDGEVSEDDERVVLGFIEASDARVLKRSLSERASDWDEGEQPCAPIVNL